MQKHLPVSLGNVWLRTFSPGTRRCALFGITAAANLLFRLDKVLRRRHVGSYIEFAISDLQPSFEREGEGAANAELSGERETEKSCKEETSKDDCNFLKGSEEAGCGAAESHRGTDTETGPGHRKCNWQLWNQWRQNTAVNLVINQPTPPFRICLSFYSGEEEEECGKYAHCQGGWF